MESEIKRSDAMIEQMQAASEESSKRAQAIIMHLSQQVERQAEQIEILQASQGFSGAIRQTVRQLKSSILRKPLRCRARNMDMRLNDLIPSSRFTARQTASAMTSTAITPTVLTGASCVPIESAKIVSPSDMVCTGRIVRAKPSCAICATFVISVGREGSVCSNDTDGCIRISSV